MKEGSFTEMLIDEPFADGYNSVRNIYKFVKMTHNTNTAHTTVKVKLKTKESDEKWVRLSNCTQAKVLILGDG